MNAPTVYLNGRLHFRGPRWSCLRRFRENISEAYYSDPTRLDGRGACHFLLPEGRRRKAGCLRHRFYVFYSTLNPMQSQSSKLGKALSEPEVKGGIAAKFAAVFPVARIEMPRMVNRSSAGIRCAIFIWLRPPSQNKTRAVYRKSAE